MNPNFSRGAREHKKRAPLLAAGELGSLLVAHGTHSRVPVA